MRKRVEWKNKNAPSRFQLYHQNKKTKLKDPSFIIKTRKSNVQIEIENTKRTHKKKPTFSPSTSTTTAMAEVAAAEEEEEEEEKGTGMVIPKSLKAGSLLSIMSPSGLGFSAPARDGRELRNGVALVWKQRKSVGCWFFKRRGGMVKAREVEWDRSRREFLSHNFSLWPRRGRYLILGPLVSRQMGLKSW